jgi:hypothetical protein
MKGKKRQKNWMLFHFDFLGHFFQKTGRISCGEVLIFGLKNAGLENFH